SRACKVWDRSARAIHGSSIPSDHVAWNCQRPIRGEISSIRPCIEQRNYLVYRTDTGVAGAPSPRTGTPTRASLFAFPTVGEPAHVVCLLLTIRPGQVDVYGA